LDESTINWDLLADIYRQNRRNNTPPPPGLDALSFTAGEQSEEPNLELPEPIEVPSIQSSSGSSIASRFTIFGDDTTLHASPQRIPFSYSKVPGKFII